MWITIGSRCCVRDAGTGAWVIAPAAATRMSHPRCRVECAVSEPVRAMLHIRPGAVGEGSAESCGNTPTLNAVEILPCAGRVPVHMGALPLEIDVLGRVRNHAENSESARGGAALECATPPHDPRGTASPGSGPPPGPHRESGSAAPIPASGTPLLVRKAHYLIENRSIDEPDVHDSAPIRCRNPE